MSPLYIPHKITVPSGQHKKLKRAIDGKTKRVTLQFTKADLQKHSSDNELLLTSGQILKLQYAHNNGTGCVLIMRRKQIGANMEHEGGFLPPSCWSSWKTDTCHSGWDRFRCFVWWC